MGGGGHGRIQRELVDGEHNEELGWKPNTTKHTGLKPFPERWKNFVRAILSAYNNICGIRTLPSSHAGFLWAEPRIFTPNPLLAFPSSSVIQVNRLGHRRSVFMAVLIHPDCSRVLSIGAAYGTTSPDR